MESQEYYSTYHLFSIIPPRGSVRVQDLVPAIVNKCYNTFGFPSK